MGHVIAIDGPAGAGKSTVARRLAKRLDFLYIDSGAMYRAIALWALRQDLSVTDTHRMEQLSRAARIELGTRTLLNEEDVTDAIRTPEVAEAASRVAEIPAVRRVMVEKQRELADSVNVVMEGRDIGTVVFPHADLKIYLDAFPSERVRRRVGECGLLPDIVAEQLEERDQRDRDRVEAPLAQAPDAVYVDSTNLSVEEVEEVILRLIRARLSNGKEYHA